MINHIIINTTMLVFIIRDRGVMVIRRIHLVNTKDDPPTQNKR